MEDLPDRWPPLLRIDSGLRWPAGPNIPLAVPELAPCTSSGHAWRPRAARYSQGAEAGPLSTKPPASGARASRLQSRVFHRLWPTRQASSTPRPTPTTWCSTLWRASQLAYDLKVAPRLVGCSAPPARLAALMAQGAPHPGAPPRPPQQPWEVSCSQAQSTFRCMRVLHCPPPGRVCDHSALEAINALAARYGALGKRVHLRHLSADQHMLKRVVLGSGRAGHLRLYGSRRPRAGARQPCGLQNRAWAA